MSDTTIDPVKRRTFLGSVVASIMALCGAKAKTPDSERLYVVTAGASLPGSMTVPLMRPCPHERCPAVKPGTAWFEVLPDMAGAPHTIYPRTKQFAVNNQTFVGTRAEIIAWWAQRLLDACDAMDECEDKLHTPEAVAIAQAKLQPFRGEVPWVTAEEAAVIEYNKRLARFF